MSSRYCIVIPHYRHQKPLAHLLVALGKLPWPVFVIDDASGEAVTSALRADLQKYDNVQLIERKDNGGKGAAMMTGINTAAQKGFSHVISLDADGQHNPDDIPNMYDLSVSHPNSFVTGRPVFGADIPASRLHGRKLTNTLVQWVTGSKMIKDAMCGLRVYPIAATTALMKKLGNRTHMEFDIEILVRAAWAGFDVQALDTKVTYPEDGESHFHLFKDNVRLVGMHTLLILGGLARAPGRLLRRTMGSSRHA